MNGEFFDMINFKELPSVEYLNECFYLDENAGILYWKYRNLYHFDCDEAEYKRFNKTYAGKISGSVIDKNRDYRCVNLDGKKYREHRIIFKMSNGYDPICVDHINGIQDDNRPTNLRSVTQLENNKNRQLQKNNKTGVTGVVKINENKWRANSIEEGSKIFNTFEEAVYYRKICEQKNNYHENHGRERNTQ